MTKEFWLVVKCLDNSFEKEVQKAASELVKPEYAWPFEVEALSRKAGFDGNYAAQQHLVFLYEALMWKIVRQNYGKRTKPQDLLGLGQKLEIDVVSAVPSYSNEIFDVAFAVRFGDGKIVSCFELEPYPEQNISKYSPDWFFEVSQESGYSCLNAYYRHSKVPQLLPNNHIELPETEPMRWVSFTPALVIDYAEWAWSGLKNVTEAHYGSVERFLELKCYWPKDFPVPDAILRKELTQEQFVFYYLFEVLPLIEAARQKCFKSCGLIPAS